jgi:glycosyltransferase involved in cell wall biosynthesis
VLIEAMAHGVPVVTTDAEGPSEIVTSGVDALLTPRGDAIAMADALEQLIKHEAEAHTMAQQAYAKVTRDYSLAAMAARLTIAFTNLHSPA